MSSFNWKSESASEWDNRAAFWNKKSRDMWDNGSRKDIVPLLSSHLKQGSKVLDIGCGDGYGTTKLYQSGFQVTGIDLSEEMIRLANTRRKERNISFMQGDVNEIPFEDNYFDAVMAINVLEWVENPLQAINELKRVVKDGGIICAGVLGPTAGPRENSYGRLVGEKAICNTMMPWEFRKLAADLGLGYADGFGVYKEGAKAVNMESLPTKLKQALTFMWVFLLKKAGESD
ncbi:class I SAM-dependent methyltransferase [Oceanobacillus damuensis]|uniref:class I SAM-dependent methyltransferase n=1 Tax=Oceanobacillus damuensis TaxID=937928 RepID=UPI00082A7E1F|nr:class I SAM-dependent methyltransferase [Oceanobacillus damuensis]